MDRQVIYQIYGQYPKIIGVDVARFGDDKTIFVMRQGPKLHEYISYAGLDNMEVAAKLVEYQLKWQAAAINIDAIGVGSGVFDRTKELGLPVHPVIVSQKSSDPMQYFNLRAQLYGETKKWLENEADIPKDETVRKQFLSMEYGFSNKMQIQLMGKKEIKSQGLDSPDIPDAIAHTFLQAAMNKHSFNMKPRPVVRTGYLWV